MAGTDRTLDEGKPLRAGALFEGIVVAHHRWGAEIAIEAAGISGIVEITKILDDRPFEEPADFPEIGKEVKGVVLGYTPKGELRLSLLRRDGAPADETDRHDEHSAGESRHDPEHRQATHYRWQARLNRVHGDPQTPNEWYVQQCGRCEFWVPLAGTWGLDYGACTNPASPFDGIVRFEHDGCDFFSDAVEWGVPEDFGPNRGP